MPNDSCVRERLHLGCTHLTGMALVVKENESLDRVDILCFSAYAVMAQADLITHLVEKLGLGGGSFRFRQAYSPNRKGCLPAVLGCFPEGFLVYSRAEIRYESVRCSYEPVVYTSMCSGIHLDESGTTLGNTPREKVDCTEIGVHYTLGDHFAGCGRVSGCLGVQRSTADGLMNLSKGPMSLCRRSFPVD
jgi:hypothetical protein